MAATLRLEVVTPTERRLAVDVEVVQFPGALGSLGVLPGHTPLLTALGVGELRFTSGGREEVYVLAGGFAEVLPDAVTLLADHVQQPDEVDVAAAREAKAKAEEALKDASPETVDELTKAVRLAETQLAVVGDA